VVLPVGLAALAAVGWALLGLRPESRRPGVTLVLGVAALAWLAVVTASTTIGFPALPRFMVVPAAVISILGAVGFVQLVHVFPHAWGRVVAAAALGAAVAAFIPPRLETLAQETRPHPGNHRERQSLIAVLERSHARERLARCGGTVGVVKATAAEIAWRLDVGLPAVSDTAVEGRITLERGVLVAQGPGPGLDAHGRLTASSGSSRAPATHLLATAGNWSVYEVGCHQPGRADTA
jgi:hypothetical protein